MHQQCQEESMSCLFFFSWFFPDFLIIFASITILGNAHRPCKQYTNIVDNGLFHVTPFTSPLNLWREDLFITLDLNEIFSVLIWFIKVPYIFVNIQSSWLRNKNTCMGNWHSLFWGCSQILLNNDSHIVLNNYKQFDHVCGETVCAYWSWTHLISNKYKQFHHICSQTICAHWSWTHIVSNKYNQFDLVHGYESSEFMKRLIYYPGSQWFFQ